MKPGAKLEGTLAIKQHNISRQRVPELETWKKILLNGGANAGLGLRCEQNLMEKENALLRLPGTRAIIQAKVIDVFGRTIPRLYAAGTTTDGWMFKTIPGSGTYLANALTFGRIAGKRAATEQPWKA